MLTRYAARILIFLYYYIILVVGIFVGIYRPTITIYLPVASSRRHGSIVPWVFVVFDIVSTFYLETHRVTIEIGDETTPQ